MVKEISTQLRCLAAIFLFFVIPSEAKEYGVTIIPDFSASLEMTKQNENNVIPSFSMAGENLPNPRSGIVEFYHFSGGRGDYYFFDNQHVVWWAYH